MYELMLSDLDETLLVNHHVPEFNVEAIKKAREHGLKFVPATGRAFNMIPEILKEIGTYDQEDEYSICFNGALIVENKNSKILNFKGLSFDVAKMLFDKGRDYDVCVLVFTVDMCYIYNADPDEVQRKKDQKAPFVVVEDYNINNLKNDRIAKILYQKKDMNYLKKIAADLKDDIENKACASYSSNRYLEFNAPGVNKGYGLKWLASYLNIDLDKTIAIGDNYNDVEMIKQAKLGVCVACGDDEIKSIANYVTKLDYNQGAVKEVIEKFILEEE